MGVFAETRGGAMPQQDRCKNVQQSEIWRDIVKNESRAMQKWETDFGPDEARFGIGGSRPSTGASRSSRGFTTARSEMSHLDDAKLTKAERKAQLLRMKAQVVESIVEAERAL